MLFTELRSLPEPNFALAHFGKLVHPQSMDTGKLPVLSSALQRSSGTKPDAREQVAAVCFRILSTGVEFLLVRTRRGRWTFPKGGAQSALTHAQSAALEAFEEAGVHGRIEEIAFLRYELRKAPREDSESLIKVHAHLCEVLRLDVPQEAGREPTWFSSRKAKRRLAEGRSPENCAELGRVVDRAVARIRRLPARSMLANDPLFTVRFESSEIDSQRLARQAASIRSLAPQSAGLLRSSAGAGSKLFRAKVLQIAPAQSKRRLT